MFALLSCLSSSFFFLSLVLHLSIRSLSRIGNWLLAGRSFMFIDPFCWLILSVGWCFLLVGSSCWLVLSVGWSFLLVVLSCRQYFRPLLPAGSLDDLPSNSPEPFNSFTRLIYIPLAKRENFQPDSQRACFQWPQKSRSLPSIAFTAWTHIHEGVREVSEHAYEQGEWA